MSTQRGWGCRGYEIWKSDTDGTYILVRNDFDILDMAGGFKDLAQHFFCNSRI